MAQPDVITIALRFGLDTALGLYQDTLYFSEEEWAKRDDKAIDAAKQQLADTWVVFMTAQIAEAEALRTKEGKQLKIDELDAKIADISAAKALLEAELAAADVGAVEARP